MRHLLLLIVIGCAIAGCATSALPTCDGSDRRPVNAPPQVHTIYNSCGATA